jgi:ubiquinone/menaquinone biosynthesis C-methylase UbiE
MLTRVLEPEVMDSPDEALDYDRMDHAEVNRRFVDDLLVACHGAETEHSQSQPDASLDVLDIGTGTAQIPIELCRRSPAVRVMAIDLAVAMLHLGRGNVEVAGLANRIRLDRVDAKRLPYEDGRFALVISNSILHHIPDPRDVLREAVRVLANGGLLFIRDLLRPGDDATVDHLVATYAKDANPRQRQLFDQSLRAALSLGEARDLASAAGLSPESVSRTSDRHWTLAVRNGSNP